MKHNLHKMLCLLLVAVLLWGTLPVALATALPVDTGQAAEPAPEASTAPTKEGTEPTEVSQPVPEETAEPQEPPAGETLPVDVPADADAPITEDAVIWPGGLVAVLWIVCPVIGHHFWKIFRFASNSSAHLLDGAVADEGADFLQASFRQPKGPQGGVGGIGQVLQRVQQGPIQVP